MPRLVAVAKSGSLRENELTQSSLYTILGVDAATRCLGRRLRIAMLQYAYAGFSPRRHATVPSASFCAIFQQMPRLPSLILRLPETAVATGLASCPVSHYAYDAATLIAHHFLPPDR